MADAMATDMTVLTEQQTGALADTIVGGGIGPDLPVEDLLPSAGGADLITAPDLPIEDMLPSAGGAATEDKKKSTFALLTVAGASLPSASSKFVGTTPKAAVMKAARRIHKRSGKTEFVVLMRRVASHKVDKKLYKYSVTMKKRSRPTGFVTLVDPRFVVEKSVKKRGVVVKHAGDVEINVAKKVPIVAASEHPVYGFVTSDGTLSKDVAAAAGAKFVVVRPRDTNTLYLVVPGAIPNAVNGIPVVKTDWDVSKLEDAEITEAEREKHDIAGRAKLAGDTHNKKKAEDAKAAAEKRRLKAKEDKARAKEAAKAKRDKERAKKEAAKAKEAERKAKAKARAAAKKH